jgi:hypothetical protein
MSHFCMKSRRIIRDKGNLTLNAFCIGDTRSVGRPLYTDLLTVYAAATSQL